MILTVVSAITSTYATATTCKITTVLCCCANCLVCTLIYQRCNDVLVRNSCCWRLTNRSYLADCSTLLFISVFRSTSLSPTFLYTYFSLSVRPSVRLSVCMSVCLSVCLPLSLSLSLALSLSFARSLSLSLSRSLSRSFARSLSLVRALALPLFCYCFSVPNFLSLAPFLTYCFRT